MKIHRAAIAAIGLCIGLSFVAPSPFVSPAAALTAVEKARLKTKKKQYGSVQRKKQNFRAARPDEWYRIMDCDDFSLSPQPFCGAGRYPPFNPYTHPQTGR